MNTPWGTADIVSEVADGVILVCTPSHGGFYLAPDRNAKVPAALRAVSFGELGEQGWYEEDCDACMVPLTFPDLFTDEQVAMAHRTYSAFFAPKLVTLKPTPVGWLNVGA